MENFTGNTFYNNILPLSIDLTYSLDASNTFHNPADNSQIKQYIGVFLEASGEFDKAIKWDETEVPYVVNDNEQASFLVALDGETGEALARAFLSRYTRPVWELMFCVQWGRMLSLAD